MTLDPIEYDKNFEFLIYKTFFEESFDEILDKHYYLRITENKDDFLNYFLKEMLLDQKAFKLALSRFYFDDKINPFNVLNTHKPEPRDSEGLIRYSFPREFNTCSNNYANQLGTAMLDTFDFIEDMFNNLYIPNSTVIRHVFEGREEDLEDLGFTPESLVGTIKGIELLEILYSDGKIEESLYHCVKQALEEGYKGVFDP